MCSFALFYSVYYVRFICRGNFGREHESVVRFICLFPGSSRCIRLDRERERESEGEREREREQTGRKIIQGQV